MLGRGRTQNAETRQPALPRWARPLEVPACPEGWHTGPPDFVGIGAQRSGTSWWYRGVEAHPQVAAIEGQAKELHYFNRFWQQEAQPGFAQEYASLFPRPESSIAGEWTPRYMLDFWTPPLLRKAAPGARLLVMLRDPVERYRSGVERAVRRSPGGAPIDLGRVSDAVHRSLYAAQLRRVLDHFPREQLLVLQLERCHDDTLSQLARTWEFLGLEPLSEVPASMLERGGPREKPELPERWRSELVARLADDVRDLASLLGDEIDLNLWPNFAGV
ncbi:MAG: sulfotransferase domain-containing protein [Solirubrobacterales bacterium]